MGLPTVKLYLDNRRSIGDSLAQVKISIGHKSKVAYIGSGVKVRTSQWDAQSERVIKHPNKVQLTDFLNSLRMQVNHIIIGLSEEGLLVGKDVSAIKKMVDGKLNDKDSRTTFYDFFNAYCNKKQGRTKEIYVTTLKRVVEYDASIKTKHFEDIDVKWLENFNNYMTQQSPSVNARNIHLRNIRAVFNDAINNEITSAYPFRKFKFKNVQTIKRSLTIEQLRHIFSIQGSEIQYEIDMFKLIFLLIGINITDLYNLTGIENGRINYYRAKTHKLYSIKVEPEALEIIEKYKGRGRLLNISEKHVTIKAFKSSIDKKLKRVYSDLSTYWARHSWATIAAELDIPIETISHALGHSYGNTTTAIYVRFNDKKIDEANRKVINFVLNNINQ